MPVSLEDMTPDERAQFNLGKLVGTMLKDPKMSPQQKRLLKMANPALSFPELEVEDAVAAVKADTSKQIQDLQDQLNVGKARIALEAEDNKISEAGLDPKQVREFMEKNGIVNVDVVIELFESRRTLAEPSSDTISPFRYKDASPEDLKKMWANPVKWREEKAYEVLAEIRGKKPIRQVG
jgi:hypothetical protein